MTADAWNGVPENPERDGWHWLGWAAEPACPRLWSASGGGWVVLSTGGIAKPSEAIVWMQRYHGPCLTPDEITAREAASAEAMREACARYADCGCSEQVKSRVRNAPHGNSPERWEACGHPLCGTLEATEIRALPLPHASALARAEKSAYQRGWNDRESDFLAGVERTGMAVVGPDALAAAEKRGMQRAKDEALVALSLLKQEGPARDGERVLRNAWNDAIEIAMDTVRNAAAQESEG